MTAKDILLAVIIPLALAEVGPWCGWIAARLLPWAAKLRYGDTERAAVRLEEWSGDLGDIPGQLTKLAYAVGQLAAGSAVSARRRTEGVLRETKIQGPISPADLPVAELDPLLKRRSMVLAALDSLSDRQRQAIWLRCSAQLSVAEIAETMGISRQSVQIHSSRGLSRLRSILGREADG